MNKLLLLPLLFYSVIVAFLFEYNFASFDLSRYQNLAEGILFGMLLFGLVSLLRVSRSRTILSIITYIVFTISIWFESGFYYLYDVNFNASTIFILSGSNLRETWSFLISQIDLTLVLFTAIMFIPLAFIIPHLVKQIRFFSWFIKPPSKLRRLISAGVLAIGIVGTLYITGMIGQNLPYVFVKTSLQYSQQTNAYNNLGLSDKIGGFKNAIRRRSDNNEIFVVVIGESHTRHKMSLYDYDRPTNPKLEALKDELVIFDQVISASTNTIKSLERSLTLANYEDSTAIQKGSIVQLFNSVGFKTYWLSNQRPLGINESLLSKIASSADESNFINMATTNLSTPFDGELLEPFDAAIDDPYPKKIIFLHLLGNHIDYNKRYPEQFGVFETLGDKHQDIEEIIDAYDNATIYNDYILSEIIKRLKSKGSESFMLYFSDHGEEVYQTKDLYGHSEEDASTPMYDVPFILWQSEDFKKNRPFRFRPYRKYMTDDLLHSIGHLANIKYDAYEAERSVFSIYYRNRTRYIQGDIDYDKLFE